MVAKLLPRWILRYGSNTSAPQIFPTIRASSRVVKTCSVSRANSPRALRYVSCGRWISCFLDVHGITDTVTISSGCTPSCHSMHGSTRDEFENHGHLFGKYGFDQRSHHGLRRFARRQMRKQIQPVNLFHQVDPCGAAAGEHWENGSWGRQAMNKFCRLLDLQEG